MCKSQDPEHGWQLSMAYDPPRTVMPEKENFLQTCYPTNTEMATYITAFSCKFESMYI